MSDAPPLPPDPYQLFKQAYDQAAEGWAKATEQVIATDEFASAAGKFVDRYADMQEAMRRTAEVAVEYLHIPSKEDVARLAQLVINVERKVDEVTDEMFELTQRLAALPVEKLAGLPDRFSALEARVDELAAASAESAKAAASAAAKPAPPADKPLAAKATATATPEAPAKPPAKPAAKTPAKTPAKPASRPGGVKKGA